MIAHQNIASLKNMKPRWIDSFQQAMRRCSYCGSIHPDHALNLLRAGGRLRRYRADQGWPDRFKILPQGLTFYSVHLVDADNETRERLIDIIYQQTDVAFALTGTKLSFSTERFAGSPRLEKFKTQD